MNDDALIRLSNLKALGLTPKLLEQRVGGRYTYWRDLLAGQKSFGEKIARKIEEAMVYPRGYLDQVIDKPTEDWPFKTLTLQQLKNLPPAYLEAIERHALDLISLAKTPTPMNMEQNDTKAKESNSFREWVSKEQDGKSGHSDSDESAKPRRERAKGS